MGSAAPLIVGVDADKLSKTDKNPSFDRLPVVSFSLGHVASVSDWSWIPFGGTAGGCSEDRGGLLARFTKRLSDLTKHGDGQRTGFQSAGEVGQRVETGAHTK